MTKVKLLVFGGTIEGRQVSEYLAARQVPHVLCVATEYGEEVLTPQPYLEIHQGRMTEEQMCAFMEQEKFAAIVDATHPYAVEVSRNIRAACEKMKQPYLRYLRPEASEAGCTAAPEPGKSIYVNSTAEAAEYLETQTGQVFLTTGSKELHIFTEKLSDKTRLFARVLPSAAVIASCRELGLEGKQICGMQGPFSADINEAMMRQTKARFLVTKDTGTSGGFPEKIEAARRLGITSVIIRRPEESGYTWEELIRRLNQYLQAEAEASEEKPETKASLRDAVSPAADASAETRQENPDSTALRQISCIGIGMGTLDTLTHEAASVIKEADILFGAGRILESVCQMFGWSQSEQTCRPCIKTEYIGERIHAYLDAHPGYRRAVILMSGDVGFYSGARGIARAFGQEPVRYYCGISSVVYFASRIPTPWQDAKLISAHGKEISLLNYVKRYPKLILLVSGAGDVEQICRELYQAQQHQVRVTVGTNLSYPEETITSGSPADFCRCTTTGLHIMMLENPQAMHILTPGIPDDLFIRGKVPMTKEEIRILSVAKLRLQEDSVVFDVGAGTGSVAAEIARLCTTGKVYAIEKNPEGIDLIRQNSRKMCLSNLVPVEGTAPEALEALPSPTHAFIGGSSGNMKGIVECLRRKNPHVRIVLNTIALESIAEVMDILKELDIKDADIVQISSARSRVLGRYHMMTGLNPVYIVSFGGVSHEEFTACPSSH